MSVIPAMGVRGFPGNRVEPQRAGITIAACMDPVHGISAADRRLMKRILVALAALFAGVAAFSRLDLLYSHKFFDVTGSAQWIWAQHQISREIPVAFFATRDFDLPPNRYYTRIKVTADPEYTLYFNGREIGGRRMGDESALDVYEVSSLARTRGNRLVIAVRSPNGVGGLIASVDIQPDFQNVVVTGRDWNIVRQWRNDLVVRDPPPGFLSAPMLLGRPPIGRWNYLSRRAGVFTPPIRRIVAPRGAFALRTALPEVRSPGGVAIIVPRPIGATVFDFGSITGRPRLTINFDNGVSRAVSVRFANDRSELMSIEGPIDPFVFAAGERTVTDPQVRDFRYIMVYGGQATADVVQ